VQNREAPESNTATKDRYRLKDEVDEKVRSKNTCIKTSPIYDKKYKNKKQNNWRG